MMTSVISKSGLLLLIFMLLIDSKSFSQNNLVVFSENGEKFHLLINGVKQNTNPESNVKVQNLIHPQYKAKIIFEEKAKGIVDWTVYLMDGGEAVNNHEFVYNVKMTKGGQFKARPMSVVAISEAKSDPSQTVVNFSTSEPNGTQSNQNSASSSTTVTTGNSTGGQSGSGNTNGSSTGIDINVNGLGVNMGVSINVNENSGAVNQSTTTTTNTTTSTSTTNISSNSSATTNANNSNSTINNTQNQNAPATLCSRPMNESDFSSAKKSIETKSFEDSKLKVAQQIADANCLSCEQIKQLMKLFSFEDSKLNFAKYAYSRCSDQKNYFKLNDAFTFESSIEDLDKYIRSIK